MAQFEGNYEIRFNLEDFSVEMKARFEDFVTKWGMEHPLGHDNWIENFNFNTYESILWGFNDSKNIEDMGMVKHRFTGYPGTR